MTDESTTPERRSMVPDTLEETGVGRWRLDPAQSTAEFRVPNFWGLVKVKGRFDRLSGWLEIGERGERRIELTIDATSLNTGNEKRDEHLRSGDFFDTENHPTVRFTSSSVRDPVSGRITVRGELLAAGHRVMLDLEPTLRQHADRLQLDASTTIDQRELGMTWSPLGITRTPATLAVHAQLTPES
jgi:polyisoprenoid-binding protein YceI